MSQLLSYLYNSRTGKFSLILLKSFPS